jgi:uncharacterized protein (TIGR02001 family)
LRTFLAPQRYYFVCLGNDRFARPSWHGACTDGVFRRIHLRRITMKLQQTLVAALSSAVLASVALAQTPATPATPAAPAAAPASPWSANVGIASSYIYRGLNQSGFKPALQLGADYAPEAGFYMGVWASSIRWLKDYNISSGRAEIDIYAGYKGSVGDFGYDVGVLQYFYPGSLKAGATRADTTEVYVAGTYKMFTAKYSHTVSPSIFAIANARNSYYLELNAAIPLMDNLNLNLHAGRQGIKRSSDGTYSDGKAELAYDFGNGFALSGGVTATNAKKSFYTPPGEKFQGKTTPYALVKYTKSF